MAMSVKEVRESLAYLNDSEEIGVDEGGLCLRATTALDWYCEIGGLPEDDDR